MKRFGKKKKTKLNTSGIAILLVLFILFAIVIVVLPNTPTNRFSFGASIPFTPVPAKSNLQLETFTLPNISPTSTSPQAPPGKSVQPTGSDQPIAVHPIATIHPLISPFKSNGQVCSGADDSGKAESGDCYCSAMTVICKNGIGYSTSGGLYPEANPCGSKDAPGSGRYCVEKPVIYLYPTTPTLVDVQVKFLTKGSVVESNPTYPTGGWKNILADPDGTLQYNGEDYPELFYESSVSNFQKPQQGITIPTSRLSEKLNTLLNQLGLIGNEKQEFLTFWLPQLEALHTPYIFFSVLTPSAKAEIDTVTISPKPDTQIAFIAYFKAVSKPAVDTLQLPPTPQREGFVSVEWGGVIDNTSLIQ